MSDIKEPAGIPVPDLPDPGNPHAWGKITDLSPEVKRIVESQNALLARERTKSLSVVDLRNEIDELRERVKVLEDKDFDRLAK